MEGAQAGSTLDSLIASFQKRIGELQELVIARNMYPARSISDLSAIDTALSSMELQVQSIKDRLREETEAIPKAKKLIEASLKQQGKLQKMSIYAPSHLPDKATMLNSDLNRCLLQENAKQYEHNPGLSSLKSDEEAVVLPKEKKGRGSPPLWHITVEELNSLSSYMRGRLTLEKVNAAINDMASYAEANAHLIAAPKQKVYQNLWEKALKLRDIVTAQAVKGKHFFLETDMKGPSLKLDNTGKAILTVLRHLGRISETRIGQNRVIILMKPH
ncbi:spindle and kinetochore-associated protein 1 homolog [Capsella rubella]|nr:spindle and kinetochore-associated protein 1 homolog [Capsella rubella]